MNVKIFYTIVTLFVIILFLLYSKRYNGPKPFSKSFGEKSESIETLLNRIDYANRSNILVSFTHKTLFFSLLSVLLVSLVSNTLFSIKIFVCCVIIVFLLFTSFLKFFDYHSEKLPRYAINRNIRLLRRKLGTRKRPLKDSKRVFLPNSECFNYRTEPYEACE